MEGKKGTIFVCNDSGYFQRHRRSIADKVAEKGHDVHVIVGGDGDEILPPTVWSYKNINIERFNFHLFRDARLAIHTALEIIRRKPISVHLITLKPIVFGGIGAIVARLLMRSRCRIVATVPGLGRLMGPDSQMSGVNANLSRALIRVVIRMLAKCNDTFITFETEADCEAWREEGIVDKEHSIVISGAGVDPASYYPMQESRPSEPLRILFASRLLRSKGLPVFLEVARAFHGRSDVKFLVAGITDQNDPDSVSPCEILSDPVISFLGFHEEMPELLREVHIVCLPTRYGEGIPRVLIEAAASGVACIASNLTGCRSIVQDGETGILIPTGSHEESVDQLREAIERYAMSPELRRAHGTAARRKFLKGEFAQESVVRQFVDLLIPSQG